MKPQTRPVIVEVKRKRGVQQRGGSIWSGVDLSAVAAEVGAEAGAAPNGPTVDSRALSADVESRHEPQVEQHMADPQEADLTQVGMEAPAKPAAPKLKPKAPRARKAKAEPKQQAAMEVAKPESKAETQPTAAARGKRKVYSKKERSQKLAEIEKSIRRGAAVKNAVGQAGISEQTFYQWKKNAAPGSTGDELTDLVELETENLRLKKRLAEHLRKENAELKKRLGEA